MNDEFDDMLRSRLQQSEPPAFSDAYSILGELKPAMKRARIRRSVAIGAATLSLLGISGVGLAAATTSLRQQPTDVDILIPSDQLPEPTSGTSVPTSINVKEADDPPPETQDELEVSSTSIPETTATLSGNAPEPTDVSPSTSAPPRQVTDTTQPLPASQPESPNTAPGSPPPSTVPLPATTTSPPPTAPPAPSGQRIIQSECGAITVNILSTSVTLDATNPVAGFNVDVKNGGPEKVEVGFAGGDLECQIKAEIKDGQLVVDVDNPDD